MSGVAVCRLAGWLTMATAIIGMDGAIVEVEVDISPGLPTFMVAGLPVRPTIPFGNSRVNDHSHLFTRQ